MSDKKRLQLKGGVSQNDLLALAEKIGLVEEKHEQTTPLTAAIPSLPKIGKEVAIDISKKRKEFEDTEEQEAFEQKCIQYETDKADYNRLKKATEEAREDILDVMNSNVQFVGSHVEVKVSAIKNESINAPLVVQSLKDDVGTLEDLARLGIISVNKRNFEAWLKSSGHDVEPFLLKGKPKLRLSVKPTRSQ